MMYSGRNPFIKWKIFTISEVPTSEFVLYVEKQTRTRGQGSNMIQEYYAERSVSKLI